MRRRRHDGAARRTAIRTVNASQGVETPWRLHASLLNSQPPASRSANAKDERGLSTRCVHEVGKSPPLHLGFHSANARYRSSVRRRRQTDAVRRETMCTVDAGEPVFYDDASAHPEFDSEECTSPPGAVRRTALRPLDVSQHLARLSPKPTRHGLHCTIERRNRARLPAPLASRRYVPSTYGGETSRDSRRRWVRDLVRVLEKVRRGRGAC